MAGVLLSVTLFDLFAHKRIEHLLYSTHLSVTSTGEAVFAQLFYVNAAIAVGLVVAVFLALRAILWRASGPLFRMKKDLLKVADGDLSTEIVLRRDDEFQEVAGTLGSMVSSLRKYFLRIRGAKKELSRALHALDKQAVNLDAGTREAALAFTEHARRLKTILDEVNVVRN